MQGPLVTGPSHTTLVDATQRGEPGYRVCALARGYDGRTRALERHGKTKAAAERALKAPLRDRTGEQTNA